MPAIGKDTITSVVRHQILPQITDVCYTKNNALLLRLIRSGKRMIQGGPQIEVPLMYKRFGLGGTYRGMQMLDIATQDTVKNAFLDWKQYYVPLAFSGLDLIRADSPMAIANIVQLQSEQMMMEMAENLAAGIFGDGVTDPNGIDGLGAIMSASNTYGGLNRSTESYWRATIDAATSTLSLTAMRGLFGNATIGGTHPTIWFGNGVNYNRLYSLMLGSNYNVQYVREPMGHDEILAQAGFTNLMFENVPFVRDDNAANNTIYALNENFLQLIVSPRADFHMPDFETTPQQDAFATKVLWAGNLMCTNPRAQAAFTNINA